MLYSLLALCACCQLAMSQGKSFTFGDIDRADLEMIAYPLDSGAEAVYLINNGEIKYNRGNYSVYLLHHVRIKILKEEGFNKADITINWLKGDKLQKLRAATYNIENGKVVTREISKKEWVDEKYSDKVMQKKLSFPDVKVGSVIEYYYEQNMGFFTSLPGWQFQQSIPVKYTEYNVEIPPIAQYQPGFKGFLRPSYYKPNRERYHVIMEDVPALKKEPYVATMENFRSEIDFEIKSYQIPGSAPEVFLEDWGAIAGSLAADDDYGEAINNLGRVNKFYPKDKGWGNNKESMIEIFNYVRDHFKWNDRYGIWLKYGPKSVWDKGEGNSGEINHVLTMLLRKAGIDANPVMLSTRRNGYLNRLVPLVSQFNYMITCAEIDGEEYLMDATEKFRPYNVLPERAINGEGLLVGEKTFNWVALRSNNEFDAMTITANIKLNDDDELNGDVSITARGTAASRMRGDLLEKLEESTEDEEPEESEASEESDDLKIGEVSNVQVNNVEDPSKSLETTYDFVTEENIDFIGDKIFMNPVLIKYIAENPFKLEKRIYPIEFPAPISNTYIFNIEIPEGFEVEELPARKNLALPEKGGRYTYLSAVQGDKVQVMIRLTLSKTRYAPEEYGALKELFNLIISNQESQIVFKEKSE